MEIRHRMIARTISTDDKVAALSCPGAMLLWSWMIPHADNLGRMRGEAEHVRLTVMPRVKGVTAAQVAKWLEEMVRSGLVDRYIESGIWVIQLSAWPKHNRCVGNMRRNSDLPERTSDVHTPYIHCTNGVHSEGEGEGEGKGEGKEEHLVPSGTANVIATSMKLMAKSKQLAQETQRLTEEFARLWELYPHWRRRSLRDESLKRWLALRPRPELEEVLAGLNAAISSEDWHAKGGQFVPGMQVWIDDHGWNASNGNGHVAQKRTAAQWAVALENGEGR